MERKQVVSYVDTISNIVISLTLFLLPLIFLTTATDAFIIPKQLLVLFSAAILLLLWGVRSLAEKKLVVVSSPFNLAFGAFAAVLIISSIISPNRYDALLQSIPAVAAIILAFIIINSVRNKMSFSMALSSYILGAAVSAVITVLYFCKLYFLPFPGIQSQFFNTTGSVIQQLIYLLPVFILACLYIGRRINFPKVRIPQDLASDYGFYIQGLTLVAVTAGLIVIIYQIVFMPNKPILLPYIYGFQTAFASISQDSARFVQSLLLGSGYGTFITDFTRYKLPSFNLEQNIWNLSFSFSSSYFLELIATTGLLGALAFIGLIVSFIRSKAPNNPIFVPLFIALILALILPFSYLSVAGLFILMGLYITFLNIEGDRRVYDVTLSLVTSKTGFSFPSFNATPEGERAPARTILLPGIVFVIILLIVGFVGFYGFKFALSDMAFAQSLVAAQANDGQKTYQLQSSAINNFPYRSDYQRIFSQVNLALANSLAAGIPQGSSPSAQVQQSIVTLLQQSINSGRNAVVLSPRTSLAWQNLGTVYRSLINVGQNADQFSIASMNQAIALDPYNPNLYILLGGIYYQLGQWDQAAGQFQVAIKLKSDFANAYYNLGHAYESKGDLQNALTAYQAVKQLSVDNKDNLGKIDQEIKAIEDKIGSQGKAAANIAPTTEQTPLSISEPTTNIPEQKPPIKISPPPSGKTTPTPSPSGSPTPSAEESPSPTQ